MGVEGTAGERSWRSDAPVYVLAAVTYVIAGIWQKGLLNWIVGPLWLIVFVAVAEAIRTRRATRSGEAER